MVFNEGNKDVCNEILLICNCGWNRVVSVKWDVTSLAGALDYIHYLSFKPESVKNRNDCINPFIKSLLTADKTTK